MSIEERIEKYLRSVYGLGFNDGTIKEQYHKPKMSFYKSKVLSLIDDIVGEVSKDIEKPEIVPWFNNAMRIVRDRYQQMKKS